MTKSKKTDQMGKALFSLYKSHGPDSPEYKALNVEFSALNKELEDAYFATLTRSQRMCLI